MSESEPPVDLPPPAEAPAVRKRPKRGSPEEAEQRRANLAKGRIALALKRNSGSPHPAGDIPLKSEDAARIVKNVGEESRRRERLAKTEGQSRKKQQRARLRKKRLDGREVDGGGHPHSGVPLPFAGRPIEMAEMTQSAWASYHGSIDAGTEEVYAKQQLKAAKVELRRIAMFGEPADEEKAEKWMKKLSAAEKRVLMWHEAMRKWQATKIQFTQMFFKAVTTMNREKNHLGNRKGEGFAAVLPTKKEELDPTTRRMLETMQRADAEVADAAPEEQTDEGVQQSERHPAVDGSTEPEAGDEPGVGLNPSGDDSREVVAAPPSTPAFGAEPPPLEEA